jgi:uncharacterized Ntn-hydrolase superfamily protein
MKTNEIILKEYYEDEEDGYTQVKVDHSRRPRITLLHLQKLRKTRSLEELEMQHRDETISTIYARQGM